MFGGGNPADKLKIKEQGRFAGDTPVNLGDVTMKSMQVGDMVMYLGQKAEVVAMSKDRKRARITIEKGMGGVTQDVNTSDLKQLGKGMAEGQFDLINDDDFYEYNVNTNEIVKRISGKHPIARQFSPMQKEWSGRDADHKIVKGMYAKYLKPKVNEKAPPGDKAERMVKHIKKNYSKDGKLTPTEKSIAYATAWKARNAGKV